MSILHSVRMIASLSCSESSRLLSDELERPLSRVERVALRCHLVLCRHCRRFRRNLRHLRAALDHLTTYTLADMEFPPGLSAEGRARIIDAVARAQAEES